MLSFSKALYTEQSFGGPEFRDSSDWSPGAPFLYAAAYYANLALLMIDRKLYGAALRATITTLILTPAHAEGLVTHGTALRENDKIAAAEARKPTTQRNRSAGAV